MDTRTREKYRVQVRVMFHLLEGHRSRLPAGMDICAALAEGMAAAHALGFDLIAGEARAVAGRASVMGRGVEALYSGPGIHAPACGIELSCPRGDQ